MIYPGALDYDSAVKAPDKFLLDPVLRSARPIMEHGSSIRPFQFSGGYARVYKFLGPAGQVYAFRCWTKDIGDQTSIYRGVGQYLKKLNTPIFVDFSFFPEAILVKFTKYPGLRMDWIEAPSLQEFAFAHRIDGGLLLACAHSFLNVARFMHSVHVAHGDLQGDNIKVCVNGGAVQIRLIDYDTMYVPTVDGRPVTIGGLGSYQHPRRGLSKKMSAKDDYFSELVIYLALTALARGEIIRSGFERRPDKDLLFSAQDFKDPEGSPLFKKLRKVEDPEVGALTRALIEACKAPGIEHLRPLEEVIERVRRSPSIFVPESRPKVPAIDPVIPFLPKEPSIFSHETTRTREPKVLITDDAAGLEIREIECVVRGRGRKAKQVSQIWVTNESDADIDVSVETDAADSHFITCDPRAFTLERGKKRQVQISAAAKEAGERDIFIRAGGSASAQTSIKIPLKLRKITRPFVTSRTVIMFVCCVIFILLVIWSLSRLYPSPKPTPPLVPAHHAVVNPNAQYEAVVHSLSGTLARVDSTRHLVVVTDSDGVPFDFVVTRGTRIEVNGKKGTLDALSGESKQQVTVKFRDMLQRGLMAESVEADR